MSSKKLVAGQLYLMGSSEEHGVGEYLGLKEGYNVIQFKPVGKHVFGETDGLVEFSSIIILTPTEEYFKPFNPKNNEQ